MEMPMPANEAERVKALHRYKILDTSPEKVYDNLTRLAAYICRTPVAVISFVDSHRLWFKSKTGIDLPITEIPRNVGCFCTHAIMLPDLFAVPNALDDERFVKSDLVASPLQVRFYAGAPLITPDGLSLGTLCVIDQKPRTGLTPEQTEALHILAYQVVTQLELRRNITSLEKAVIERVKAETEIKELNQTLERRVTERTAQLEEKTVELTRVNLDLLRSRDEMETLTYTTTHDLKTPVVSIHGIASILKEQYKDKLDEEGQRYFTRLLDNVAFMGQLISDILEYIKISRHERLAETLEPGKIVNDVLSQFWDEIQRRKIDLQVHIAPAQIIFDKDQLTQVFFHLIGNALRFMGDQPRPAVTIGSRRAEDGLVFFVKDNGIGIDPQYHEIIFAPFHRLKEIETEGTGIGLALVQKIVQRAGGEVWLESKKGEGTTFFFRLPQGGPAPKTAATDAGRSTPGLSD